MPPQTTRPPLRNAASAAGTSVAHRREQDRGVERLRRRVVRPARPVDADRARERLTGMVARPGEGEHAPPLPATDLGDDVPSGAEAINADRPPVSGELERAPADQARAEQRRRRDRVEVLGKRKDEVRVGDRMGREPAVPGVAGEERRIAQIFTSAAAIGASPVGVAEPSHADARAKLEADPCADRVDAADNLMARHDGQLGVGQLAVDDMEVGAADTASLDPHANLTGSGRWVSPLLHHEPFVRPMQDHGAHRSAPLQARREPATDRRRSA